jgi:hypothetical protein
MGHNAVMLSTFATLSVNSAKHLSAQRDRPLRFAQGDSVGADKSALAGYPAIQMNN